MLYAHFTVLDFVGKFEIYILVVEKSVALFLDSRKYVAGVVDNVLKIVDVGRVERKSYLRHYLGQIDLYYAVIVSNLGGLDCLVVVESASYAVIVFDFLVVRGPYRRKTGRLGSHYVNAVAVFDRQILNTVAHKLHNFVLDETALEHRADNSKRDVLRSYALLRLTCKVDCDNVGIFYIVSALQKLFYEFWTALAHCHSTERAVSRVGVRAEQHFTATRHALSHIRMYYRLMRGYENSAILLSRRQTEYVVVLVDSTAYRAK